ncbi:hypothetical protein EPN42_11405 [bacterium]|nr:MAG: hypothetical protein EPN42_11405 [bacterium]
MGQEPDVTIVAKSSSAVCMQWRTTCRHSQTPPRNDWEVPRKMTIERFVGRVAAVRLPGVFNPWGQRAPHDAAAGGPAARRRYLRAHLSIVDPALLIVGEAPGYRGCRYSGIPFTDERKLLAGAVPRVAPPSGRLTTFPLSLTELTATIMWKALFDFGVAERTVFWSAFPWHPFRSPEQHTNRRPTVQELELALPFLEETLARYPNTHVATLGRVAEWSLRRLGRATSPVLRHPANGGATAFRTGLHRLLRDYGL